MAFLPLQVIIVTLVLDRIIRAREKREKLIKINVVISSFYIEVGTSTVATMSGFIKNICELRQILGIKTSWTDVDFKNAVKFVDGYVFEADSSAGDLDTLKAFLMEKKQYMLSMFKNPNLLEHDTFTDMLWAVFHVSDELQSRESLQGLPAKDMEHLSGDIGRAYRLLLVEWTYYMYHLKKEYPYLFSLAVRKNPFCSTGSVIIQ